MFKVKICQKNPKQKKATKFIFEYSKVSDKVSKN